MPYDLPCLRAPGFVSDFHRLIDTMNATTPTLLYQHLADDVASMIASGTLRPGDKLPSLREMRTRRQVSLTTVTEAFRVLEDRGLIEARPQSGF